MQRTAIKIQSIVFAFFVVAVLSGCPNGMENASDSPTAQQRFAKSLAGTWSYPSCWLESTTNLFHENWEDTYSEDWTFKIVRSLFTDSNCATNPIARVTRYGRYTLGKEVIAAFEGSPEKKVAAREIDYRTDRYEIEGHKLLAQAEAGIAIPKYNYDITYVEASKRYDGNKGLADTAAERSTQLYYTELTRTSGLSGKTVDPSPSFNAAPTADKLVGTWDDDCYADAQTPGHYQSILFTFALPNTHTFKSSLWTASGCSGVEKASITFNGTFTLIDNVVTSVTQAAAARMEFTLATATVTGDEALATASLPPKDWAGKTYYHLVAYDATYDLIFYGGWFENSLAELPSEIDSGMARLGRPPLPRTASRQRE